MKKFNTWLENRDPKMSKAILDEGPLLNKLASLGALGVTGLGGYHSMEPSIQKGVPAMVGKQYPGHKDQHHTGHSVDPSPHHGHSNIGGIGPDPDNHHGDHEDDHSDHGHGHDHSDHLHAHLFGDREKEKEEEDHEKFNNLNTWAKTGEAVKWLQNNDGNYTHQDIKNLAHHIGKTHGEVDDVNLFNLLKQFGTKLKGKIFQKQISTLPSNKELTQPTHVDTGDEDLSSISPQVNVPGVGWRPGINPISVGQAHYQQLRAGEKPHVQNDPFDFSGKAADAPVNPQIAKFAQWMKNRKR